MAAELAELLTAAGLGAIAARDTADEDRFVAALSFPGSLLVVSARYEVPIYVEQKIADAEYREVYIDLNAASIPQTKVLITDTGADGLSSGEDSARHGGHRVRPGQVRRRCGRRRPVRAHAAGADRGGALSTESVGGRANLPVHCEYRHAAGAIEIGRLAQW